VAAPTIPFESATGNNNKPDTTFEEAYGCLIANIEGVDIGHYADETVEVGSHLVGTLRAHTLQRICGGCRQLTLLQA